MFDGCIYFSLNALTRDLNRLWEKELKKLGLTPPQAYLLALTLRQPGLPQKELARILHLDRSTMTRFVDGLLNKGLLKTESAKDDARVVRVFPAAKAESLAKPLFKALEKLTAMVTKAASERELAEMLKLSAGFRKKMAATA